MLDGNIRTFKYYKDEKIINYISIISSSKVIKYDDKLFAFEISSIGMKNMIITENISLQLIDSSFLDMIKKLSDARYSIYMIVEKKDLAWTCWLNEITYYKKFMRYFSKFKIKIKGWPEGDVIDKILLLPSNVSYTFVICGCLDESLRFLDDDRFVNKVKELNGKITCRGIDIDVKQLCLEETKDFLLDNLKRKIEDNDLE